MSNPFDSPSLSGYNASPPSDDGSQTSTNQVEWSKHISKIGDPIKTYAAAIASAASAAHGLAFGAAILSKSAAYTVTTADRGRFISVTGTTTITLPAAADAGEGFPLLIVNTGSATVTVDGNSSETINGVTSYTLEPGDGILVTCNSTSWSALFVPGQYEGSFTANWTGFSTSQSTTVYFTKVGNQVTLWLTDRPTGTSNATTFVSGAEIPSVLRPSGNASFAVEVQNNGTWQLGRLFVNTTGTISFALAGGSAFTASGSKSFVSDTNVTYTINPDVS